ncbi:MAG TPA: Sua5/YciO/YrdC/YwlC family protein [Solirubrobacteraceae bacterium]|nr:Sua5/YciO/YrdC/YwlC family protein [Solirubrobacteraceae bacterium]
MLSAADAQRFADCIAGGGIAIIATDTVYGLACDPEQEIAVRRLQMLKRRPTEQPMAVMFFALRPALAALGDLGPNTLSALERLLPGPVSLLLPNPAGRFPLACGSDAATLGLRVPALTPRIAALAVLERPVLQSSANRHGQPDARNAAGIAPELRAAADLVLEGGDLPGTPSTVIDLRAYERTSEWRIVRPGALARHEVAAALTN